MSTVEKPEVRFLPAGREKLTGGFDELLRGFNAGARLRATDILAVKLHPGEEGNTSHVKPAEVAGILAALRPGTQRIFLTDTTVLYPGRRMNAPDYLKLAGEHGFGPPATPPFIAADGLRGESEIRVSTPRGFLTQEAHIASLIGTADAMVVISHFKGHMLAGFGGALKNLGMGCASRAGKLYQHSSVRPLIEAEKCVACGVCAAHCPAGAIRVGKAAEIDAELCTGCGECLGRCPAGAISVSWDQDFEVFIRRMAEYAWAAVSVSNPILYVNFVTSVVPDCDCMRDTGPALVDDLGVLASADPVAVDSASLDLVTSAPPAAGSPVKASSGEDKFKAIRPDIKGELQLEIAESLGLGSAAYRLRRVSA